MTSASSQLILEEASAVWSTAELTKLPIPIEPRNETSINSNARGVSPHSGTVRPTPAPAANISSKANYDFLVSMSRSLSPFQNCR